MISKSTFCFQCITQLQLLCPLTVFASVHYSCPLGFCVDADVLILLTPPTEVEVNFLISVRLLRKPSVVRLLLAKVGVLQMSFYNPNLVIMFPNLMCQYLYATHFESLKDHTSLFLTSHYYLPYLLQLLKI